MKPLEKIVQTLIINGTLIDQPGLFYGKTGIAVFFFHYARQTGNELFQDYAIELIEEVQKQITAEISARYDTGLAGIGVGFEYFLQNGFLEADDDIFEDFDAKMYRVAMYEPYLNLSLEVGLTGWGQYFINRLSGNGQKNDKLHEALTHIAKEITNRVLRNNVSEYEQPDVFRFLHDLVILPDFAEKYDQSLEQCKKWKCVCEPDVAKLFPHMNYLQRLYACRHYFNMDLTEKIGQEWERWEKTDDAIMDLGLPNGMSSNALLHLTRLHENNSSWVKLL